MEESASAQDAVDVETAATRTTGRQRKRTWKLAEISEELEPTPPPKRRATPLSRRKVSASKLPLPDKSPTPLSVSKRKVTPLKRKKPSDSQATPLADEPPPQPVAQTPTKPITLPSVISPQEIASASIAILEEQKLDLPIPATPTSKKRGRPPKDRNLNGQIQSPSSVLLGETPSKRSRKTKSLLEVDDVDTTPLTPSKKAARLAAEIRPVKSVSWQQYKEDGIAPVSRPDLNSAHARLLSLLDDEENRASLRNIRLRALRYLTGKRHLPLQGLDDEYHKVRSIVKQTVAAGESNSILLIGPRGSGKTAMVNTIMQEMKSEHHDEFHAIHLSGFIHTDDKLALREIWRQLGREMEVEDESMAERSNYADTLASLLAVLSHPTEQPEAAPAPDHIAKSVVFIIDEFDLFTTHARQTLLYNLFDIAQSRKAPIAVLGLTTRVDVVESLEKRVKSRFSHRYVFLARPKTFHAFQQIICSALTADEPEDSTKPPKTRARLGSTPTIETTPADDPPPKACLANGSTPTPSSHHAVRSAWNDYMTSLFGESTSLTSMLRMIYATSRSVPIALAALVAPVAAGLASSSSSSSSSSASTRVPSDGDFAAQPLLAADSKLGLLPALGEAELALLIAAARLDIVLDVDTCNFNMAYDEYATLANRVRVQASASGALAVGAASGAARLWSRDAGLAAWERLEALELIMPLATAGYGAGSGLADVGRAGKLMRCDVSLEEIKWSGLDMGQQMMKWCKEI